MPQGSMSQRRGASGLFANSWGPLEVLSTQLDVGRIRVREITPILLIRRRFTVRLHDASIGSEIPMLLIAKHFFNTLPGNHPAPRMAARRS